MASIEFTSVPNGLPAEDTHSINVIVDTDEVTNNSGDVADVEAEVTLSINGSSIGDLTSGGTSGDQLSFEFVNYFQESGDYNITAVVVIDYYGIPGFNKQVDGDETYDVSRSITIAQSREDRRQTIRQEGGRQNYAKAYENRASTIITDITTDSDVELAFNEIDFSPYDNPNIAIDSSARFAVHDIIGGTTVRQKIGEDPTEVSMNGVCREEVALQVDALRHTKLVTLLSDRIPNGMRCQVASASTEPLDDGGATDMDRGDFLYEYNINLVEIDTTIQQ